MRKDTSKAAKKRLKSLKENEKLARRITTEFLFKRMAVKVEEKIKRERNVTRRIKERLQSCSELN